MFMLSSLQQWCQVKLDHHCWGKVFCSPLFQMDTAFDQILIFPSLKVNRFKLLKYWKLFRNGITISINSYLNLSLKEKTVIENASSVLSHAVNELFDILLKMESNTAKLKAEAEARILQEMVEEEALHNEVQEKKRRYLLMEKERLVNEMLDLQIAALTPVAEAAKQFTKDYKTFATAVDTTRHELPEFMANAINGVFNFPSTFSELLELSSLVSRHTIHVQQSTEEEQLGTARTNELYCPKQ
uniref:Uncharacterized protein n=1 Tax=Dicentrarchus labrax TaxID=13489 RepID=A0A8C4DJF8_DICLA